CLDPGAQLDFPGPGAAVLAIEMEIAVGDRLGIEHRIGPALGEPGIAGAADPAVDHDVADMDVLRLQLPRQALREAAQGELAHREGGRAGIALDAGAGAGEQDRAAALLYHALRRRPRDEKPADR